MSSDPLRYLDETPLTALLPIPPAFLVACARKAESLLQADCFAAAEQIARGLVAADHRDGAYRALLARSLDRLGRRREARTVVRDGLRYRPEHAELIELERALGPGTRA